MRSRLGSWANRWRETFHLVCWALELDCYNQRKHIKKHQFPLIIASLLSSHLGAISVTACSVFFCNGCYSNSGCKIVGARISYNYLNGFSEELNGYRPEYGWTFIHQAYTVTRCLSHMPKKRCGHRRCSYPLPNGHKSSLLPCVHRVQTDCLSATYSHFMFYAAEIT